MSNGPHQDMRKKRRQEYIRQRRHAESSLNNSERKIGEQSRLVKSFRPMNSVSPSGREWADHKYIDKVKTKTGKIRYIYELPDGTRVGYDKGSKEQERAQKEGHDQYGNTNLYRAARQSMGRKALDSAGSAVGNLFKGNLDEASKNFNETQRSLDSLSGMAAKQAKQTFDDVSAKAGKAAKDFLDDATPKAKQILDDVSSKAGKALADASAKAGQTLSEISAKAGKAAKDGAAYVSNMVSSAIANIPVKDLFK